MSTGQQKPQNAAGQTKENQKTGCKEPKTPYYPEISTLAFEPEMASSKYRRLENSIQEFLE
jgi:hypothetical protein